jgi:hypothetical protein
MSESEVQASAAQHVQNNLVKVVTNFNVPVVDILTVLRLFA